jgi:hypothetical protein
VLEVYENIDTSFLTILCFWKFKLRKKVSDFHYRQIYLGYSVFLTRIDPDFTVNEPETAEEVNVLRKPPINLQESTM